MNCRRRGLMGAVVAAFANLAVFASSGAATADSSSSQASTVDPGGTVHVQPLDVPFSSFASAESQKAFVARTTGSRGGPPAGADVKTLREFYDKYNVALAR